MEKEHVDKNGQQEERADGKNCPRCGHSAVGVDGKCAVPGCTCDYSREVGQARAELSPQSNCAVCRHAKSSHKGTWCRECIEQCANHEYLADRGLKPSSDTVGATEVAGYGSEEIARAAKRIADIYVSYETSCSEEQDETIYTMMIDGVSQILREELGGLKPPSETAQGKEIDWAERIVSELRRMPDERQITNMIQEYDARQAPPKPSADSPARICGNCGLPLAPSETEQQCREIFGDKDR